MSDPTTMASTTPATERPADTCPVLGVPVSLLGMDATVSAIEAMVGSAAGSMVVTADSSGLAAAQDDPELRDIYLRSAMATADSIGVVWALRRRGHHVKRVSGVDLVDRLCALSAEKGYRIFFLGSAPGVAETAAEKIRLRHPGCNIVGTRHGYFPATDDDVVAREVAEAKPDLLFVAMGIPRQEKFIFRTQAITGAKVAMGVGGSLDVFSGQVKRAPKLIQRLHMEWAWRLMLNPKKIHKVKMLPRFVWHVLREGR
ncbi:MAG: WecB/TagA/CpsF family glycosyltransferase [Fimbriimonadaceae bacterium]|nr:WecB/TagA/CpsF family glycosyltransferase [Fimbriimonadaceae bacterium]